MPALLCGQAHSLAIQTTWSSVPGQKVAAVIPVCGRCQFAQEEAEKKQTDIDHTRHIGCSCQPTDQDGGDDDEEDPYSPYCKTTLATNNGTSVINAGSLQMSCWKLQQYRNCKSKLRKNHYKLYLKCPMYDLYRHITATSTFMLPLPIATISYFKNITVVS
jgi:hypothetical protein